MIKLTDFVVGFLEKNNVKDVFMVTGGGCMHLADSFGKSTKIKYTELKENFHKEGITLLLKNQIFIDK